MRLPNKMMALTALASCLAWGGTSARAALTLSITDKFVPAGNQTQSGNLTLTITDGTTTGAGTGTFSLTSTGTVAGSYTFTIDGQTFSNVAVNSGPMNFSTLNVNSLSFNSSAFGQYNITTLNISQSASPTAASINDTTADVGKSGSGNDTLTIGVSSTLAQPTNQPALLNSLLGQNNTIGDKNATVTFSSTIVNPDTTTTSTATLTATHDNPNAGNSATLVQLGAGPYTVSNTITINGQNSGNNNSIGLHAATSVVPTPEPATLVMAFTLAPMALVLRRRAAKA